MSDHGPCSQTETNESKEDALAAALNRFNNKFPDDKHCIEEILRRLKVLECKYCRSTVIERGFGERTFHCRNCGSNNWPFSKTFFRRMKRPKLYLGVIWLHEQNLTFSAKWLEKNFEVSYASAFYLLLKFRVFAFEAMSVDGTIDSNEFKTVFCRRSRESHAGEHPSSWEEKITAESSDTDGAGYENRDQGFDADSTNNSANSPDSFGITILEENSSESDSMSPIEKQVYELLSLKPTSIDELVTLTGRRTSEIAVALTMLEFGESIRCLPGNRYVLQEKAKLVSIGDKVSKSSISKICQFLKDYYGGISHKYLQTYIAGCWAATSLGSSLSHKLFGVLTNFDAWKKGLEVLTNRMFVTVPEFGS